MIRFFKLLLCFLVNVLFINKLIITGYNNQNYVNKDPLSFKKYSKYKNIENYLKKSNLKGKLSFRRKKFINIKK